MRMQTHFYRKWNHTVYILNQYLYLLQCILDLVLYQHV